MINTDIHLAILGYGKECTKKNASIATSIGKLAGKQGVSLVAGNVSSTFGYAFKAAKAYHAPTICVIEKHKRTSKEHDASKIIRTKDTHYKHNQIAQIADAAVLIGGGAGSQLLLKYFIKNKKTVIAIKGSGGLADKNLPPQVLIASSAREAWSILNSINYQCSLSIPFGLLKLTYDHFALREAIITPEQSSSNCKNTHAFQQQFKEYMDANRKEFNGKVHLIGTDFQKKVWNALLKIPFGKTISYGDLAHQLGDKKAGRAVGHAAAQNPIWVIVPCHRLIGKSGDLTGYAGGLEMKMRLLDLEGRQTELNLF
ncbi:MAG: methylated-DNA--[protein]-cysteine S-methyltransferase [Bacteroidales bacterium]|nr:methylated-DNA--[protein]-cysteine S-methyltransferase [Bacteroidales bacterium]